jgi:hypothetical protein
MAVSDKASKALFGHALSQDMAEGGCAYLLAFCNGSGAAEEIGYRLQSEGEFAKGMKAVLYDESTGRYGAATGEGSVSVAAGGREYRWLFVGSPSYLAKASAMVMRTKLDLVGVYRGISGRSMRIRYSLPGEGVSRVQFGIYDVSGRLVWRRVVESRGESGTREVVWDGRATGGRAVASGMYVLRTSVLADIPSGVPCDFPRDIFPKMIEKKLVRGFPLTGTGPPVEHKQLHLRRFGGRSDDHGLNFGRSCDDDCLLNHLRCRNGSWSGRSAGGEDQAE